MNGVERPFSVDFSGQRVLVTGATRGIGAAIADAFAASGASLVLTGTDPGDVRRRADAANGSGDDVEWIQADFASRTSLAAFLDRIAAFDRLDVLVNNAGVNRLRAFDEVSADDYDWLTDVNLRAPFLVAIAAAKLMRQAGRGRIVNITSIWGSVTKPQRAMYTVSKHGLIGLTKTLAVELAAHNILVNAVAPGFTLTELTKSTLSSGEIEALAQQVPARRFAVPDEIAKVVVFLASSLNTYLTGQNIVVDGGFTII